MTDLAAYHALVARKVPQPPMRGIAGDIALNPRMTPLQMDVTSFALRQGQAALFKDTGLGKTLDQLEFGRVVVERTNTPFLLLAPLAVGAQHAREAEKFGIDARVVREPGEIGRRVNIVNYERLDRFDPQAFGGVALDESSILKSFTGATTRKLISAFARTPFRLAATATPAPNDHTELGQHADFLGIMPSPEMLSRFFIADQTEMGRYRLKRAAVRPFWAWVASWARCVSKPSDLGHSDAGYELPPLDVVLHELDVDRAAAAGCDRFGQEMMFRLPDVSATGLHAEKRRTVETRVDHVAGLVSAEPDEAWIVWCDTNYEADALCAALPDALDVRGSMSPEEKEEKLVAFSLGQAKRIVTKPSIAGFGLNWQHCARHAFADMSYSYESFYQAVRRSWRFGQTRPVKAHVAIAETQVAAWRSVMRKAADHETMKRQMAEAMRSVGVENPIFQAYRPGQPATLPDWLRTAA